MSRHTLGEKSNGPVKQGNWGDRFTIIYPESDIDPNKISCKLCRNYRQDKSCSINDARISSLGYNYWRHCKYFNYVHLLDDANINENVDNLCNTLQFSKSFRRKVNSNIIVRLFVKRKITELLYTGLLDEREFMYDEIEFDFFDERKKKNLKHIKEKYSDYPDISNNQKEEIEKYIRNIVVLALEKDISFNEVFKSVRESFKQNLYCRQYYEHKDYSNLDLYDSFSSYNYPFYSLLFISEVKKALNCSFEDIFDMTDDDRNNRLIKLFNNKLEFEFYDTEEFKVIRTYKSDDRIFELSGERKFNKELNKFEFSIYFGTINKFTLGYEELTFIPLYRETDNGPLIKQLLDTYDFEVEADCELLL